jgi:hypothetical protein
MKGVLLCHLIKQVTKSNQGYLGFKPWGQVTLVQNYHHMVRSDNPNFFQQVCVFKKLEEVF